MRLIVAVVTLAGLALLLRSTALSVLAGRGIVIDVLAFVTVVWALRAGEMWGSSFGFAIGLAADLDAAHWLGRHALVLAVVGYLAGRLGRAFVRDSAVIQMVLLALATAVHQLWVFAFETTTVAAWRFALIQVGIAVVVTAISGTLLLTLMRWGGGQPLFGSDVHREPGSSS
jgi:rod shape-determining protein MreD